MIKAYNIHKVQNDATQYDTVIDIFDEIHDWWGYNLQYLIWDLREAKNVLIRFNSIGGLYFEAIAIANYIKASNKNIDTQVLGMAASAATPILLAGNKVQAIKDSWIMVHQATLGTSGKKEDLRSSADTLEKIDAQLVDIYLRQMKKNGKADNEVEATNKVKGWIAAETWFTADQALAEGLIDEVIEFSASEVSSILPVEQFNSVYKQARACVDYNNVPQNVLDILNISNNNLTMSKVKVPATNFFAALQSFFTNKGNVSDDGTIEVDTATIEPAAPPKELSVEEIKAQAIEEYKASIAPKVEAPKAMSVDEIKAQAIEEYKASLQIGGDDTDGIDSKKTKPSAGSSIDEILNKRASKFKVLKEALINQ